MVGHLPTVTLQLLYTRPRQHVAAGRETRASRVLSQITFVLLCFIFYWFELVGMWFHCCFASHRDSFCGRWLIQNVFISVCCLPDYCCLFLLLFFLSRFLHLIVFSSLSLCLPVHPLLSFSSHNYFQFFAHSLPQWLPVLHFILLSSPTCTICLSSSSTSSAFLSSYSLDSYTSYTVIYHIFLSHFLYFQFFIFFFSHFFHSTVSPHLLPLLLPPRFSSISSSSGTLSSSVSSQLLLLSLCPSPPDLPLHLLCFSSCSSFLSASFSRPSSSFSSFVSSPASFTFTFFFFLCCHYFFFFLFRFVVTSYTYVFLFFTFLS